MTDTLRLPGIPVGTSSVHPDLVNFINDVIYQTYYSESSGIGPGNFLEDTPGSPGKYVGPGVSASTIQSALEANIQTLLSGPYASTQIQNATVQLLLEEQTSKGRILHWRITISSDVPLIMVDLMGAILYDLK